MGLTAIFDDEGDDAAGEVDVLGGAFNVLKDGVARIGGWTDRGVALSVDGEIEWKFKFTAHGGNASDNVGAIDGATVPGVGGEHGGLLPDEMCAAIRASYGHGFVEVSEEAFNADSFMVTTGSGVEADAEEGAGVGEDATEGAAGVDYDQAAHANLQQNILEQKTSELMGMYIRDGDADDELRQVTHGG